MPAQLPPTDLTSQLARRLARIWTPAEREAWRILDRGILGYTFRRHALLDGMLVGFYCPELGVIIQLDDDNASNEDGPIETRMLEGVQLRVARLSSHQVNRASIVEAIERAVKPGRLWPED